MDTRREFIKKAALLSGGAGLLNVLPASIAKALAIDPAAGSTFLDAEHIVFLMQENRSFDHTYGTLQGVRGFNDPRAIRLPDKNLVWLQTNNRGETFAPFRFDIKGTKVTWMSSLPHSWNNQVAARNNGKYDKWLEAKASGDKAYKDMPLTLGYYTREDIPFYYSLADAFTVCDQNFCSSLTGTTPNRLYFWTGTIREKQEAGMPARVLNRDADYDTMVDWKTYPERLEEHDISWKIYQNELSVGVGLANEEESWLANYGDNPLEYFSQYQVKLSAEYIAHLPEAARQLKATLEKKEKELLTVAATGAEKLKKDIERLKKQLAGNEADQANFTIAKYEQLSPREKSIHDKAFSTNRGDPDYHRLTSLEYKDGNEQRQLNIPKGDILHEFRKDVENKTLPTVSWLVAPENFSDHPSSAWYGAWYISEVMDILTRDPEVWKKTIFILTYDENDGYFDHVPPFVAPHPVKTGTGLTSKGIDTGVEFVVGAAQQATAGNEMESPIGLGYRVPMVIASPWSRGGWVNSEVFDHSSSLQFLEKFIAGKFGKQIKETNLSEWRRTVCGDLSSAFRPYNGEKLKKPTFLHKKDFVESIHKAQFKNPPSNYKKLTPSEIGSINKEAHATGLLASQEKGIRDSNALPYELYVDGKRGEDGNTFGISFTAGNTVFGPAAAGCPFVVYAPGRYENELVRTWDYALRAGDTLKDSWQISQFENGHYHLQVYGPNGFFREFAGVNNGGDLEVMVGYERSGTSEKKLTGKLSITVHNPSGNIRLIDITDNAYGLKKQQHTIAAGGSKIILVDASKSFGWYDLTVSIPSGVAGYKRYAGRIETGNAGKTDPLMGQLTS